MEEVFDPQNYLQAYYSKLEIENQRLLKFFHQVYSQLSPQNILVELGGGPTLYQLISACNRVKKIFFSEYSAENQDEILKWQTQNRTSFNWDNYFDYVLNLEGKKVNTINREKRKNILRQKIRLLLDCNIFKKNPLAPLNHTKIDILSVNFIAESITDQQTKFNSSIKNICKILPTKSLLVMTLLRNSNYYLIGNQKFKAFPINEPGIYHLLKKNQLKVLTMQSFNSPYNKGYDGVITLTAIKSFSIKS